MLLLEPRIVPFVTLAADFVQAAQRGGVELKNGGSPAVYSGKNIGIVTLVVHDVAQIIFLHIVHEGGAVHLQHPVTEKCLITGERLTKVLRHGDALSGVDRKKLHLDRRGIRVAFHLNAVGVAFIGAGYVDVERKKMKLGVDVLPRFARDTTDRNRTSPFAFTGNKFEFRMVGSSDSIACANIMLNAAVAQSLKCYADELEQAEDFNTALHERIKRTIKEHKRIIFNGNGYDDAWIREATEERGLLNLRTTPDAIPELLKAKNVEMLTDHGVYTEAELRSRYEIMLENYCKTVCIEAQTMSDMARKQILPAVARYAADVAWAAADKKSLDGEISCGYETKLVKKLTAVTESIDARVDALDSTIARFKTICDVTEGANFIRDEMLSRMTVLRSAADEAETLTAESAWPFPTYGELLFSVR